ncbi:SETdomain-containing protein [Cordyceps javanica]|uniref:SETdomain-containing protein n=1 Tax=Cordyceps javanica TaxID=43265 RepID=A0A545VDD3_9HYPO|nr:SETdomain-containing protein [Cordyceps javanica]TQW10593.1 SET domain-containing protein [Cordyceps javanica]
MAEVHRCSYACGLGSTLRSAKDMDMERERQLKLQIAARPVQSNSGKTALVHAGTQVDTRLPQSRANMLRAVAEARALEQNFDILYVHETGTYRRLGVFAGRDLSKGRKIIAEYPTFSCFHWNKGKRTAVDEWLSLSHRHRESMRVWFRKLRKMAHGGNDTFVKKDKKRLNQFITDYAFLDPQRERAHIYRLSSYINHACRSCANAQFWVDGAHPNCINVSLVRDVKDGDEIFIFYNRPNLRFGCAVCQQWQPLGNMVGAFFRNLCKRRGKAVAAGNESTNGGGRGVTKSSVNTSTALEEAVLAKS